VKKNLVEEYVKSEAGENSAALNLMFRRKQIPELH